MSASDVLPLVLQEAERITNGIAAFSETVQKAHGNIPPESQI
jgi:hypothetical protein